MTPEQLKTRTRSFAMRLIRLVQSLPENRVGRLLGDQLLRAGTSVGANYRAACRARSPAEFRSKLGIAEEEVDETIYWMELISEAELVPPNRLTELLREAAEIMAILVASIQTSRRKKP